MFDPARLATVPKESELHHWADFVEILCLTDIDGSYSAERLAQTAKFAADFQATMPDAQDQDELDVLDLVIAQVESAEVGFDGVPENAPPDNQHDLDTDEFDDDGAEAMDGPVASTTTRRVGRAAEIADNRYEWCRSIFELLVDRANTLGEAYPFDVDERILSIVRRDQTTPRLRYIFYLCCAQLSCFDRSDQQSLTSWFEYLSADVLRDFLPPPIEIDHYGTARSLRTSKFTGTPHKRLLALAAELRGVVLADPSDFHPRDTGDNGLDLVAWRPTSDRAAGVLTFFCQCACGKKWEAKQYEASHERWSQYIFLKSPITKITFIPHFFRRPGGDWYSASDVSGMLVDRLRAFLISPGAVLPGDALIMAEKAWSFRLASV